MFAAFTLGLRHGVDWDHVAAITDLTGSQARPRRSMLLATLYVLGHATTVLTLGAVAIFFGGRLPSSLDTAMRYVVGGTLVALGVYVVWILVRTRGDIPVASRWMLAIAAIRRGFRLARAPTGFDLRRAPKAVGFCDQKELGARDDDDVFVIEHAHEHSHDGLHDHSHDHCHDDAELRAQAGREVVEHSRVVTATRHGHTHKHVVNMPADPFVTVGPWAAGGIGMLHGIGAETPTQILIFAAAADVTGRGASFVILVSFIVGLLCSNTLIALGSTFGFLGVGANKAILVTLSLATAVVSLGVGLLLLTGQSHLLPPLFPG
ncbi:MAG: hypothetical protein JWL83_2313 [Actinomycetia bacterium]|nr:hypothetical protein [Actinomycetes bacterium]